MAAFDTAYKLIEKWKPGVHGTELKYRDSLAALLRAQLADATIETEYRHNGTTTDIYFRQAGFFGSSEVFIELKRNLLQKTQLDRLVGQIYALEPKENKVIVVLCGEANPALVSRFKKLFEVSSGSDLLISSFRVALVIKGQAASK